MAAAIVGTTGALIGMRGAMAALSYVGLMGKSGLLGMALAVSRIGGRFAFAASEAMRLQRTLAAMNGVAKVGALSQMGTALRAMAMALAAPSHSSLTPDRRTRHLDRPRAHPLSAIAP